MANALEAHALGKMYRLFDKQSDRIRDLFGIEKLRFWNHEPKYREFWALRNVDLVVPKGERIGIIGRNGAGKSTLLKLIVGNLKPTEGSVKVNGNIQALLQIGTGFHPEFTGIENIRTALAYAGMDHRKVERSIDEIVEFSELEDYINQPVKYYSAGMYSRLAFAVSTSLEPDILIIDEVLGAGDAAFTSKCAERMKHLTQETGATVLFVSHSMDSVLEICNNAILLERGEITHRGTALEVSKIYNRKIRDEEELRARAKEYRVSRKTMLSITQADEATQVLVFRFVCDQDHPSFSHLIYCCELLSEDQLISTLHMGAPMDNDPEQFTHVIVEKGAMDWGNAKKDRGNFCRAYCDQNGTNCHAPFQMALPLHLAVRPLTIRVNARPDTRERIYLEYFNGHGYHRLGEIQNGWTSFDFQLEESAVSEKEESIRTEPISQKVVELSSKDAQSQAPSAQVCANQDDQKTDDGSPVAVPAEAEASSLEGLKKTNSLYGSLKMVIDNLDIFDGRGKSSRVFITGDTLRFQIRAHTVQPVLSFVAVVCVMTRDGKVATQVFCPSESIGIEALNGEIVLDACLCPLRLGAGEYMVSIGIFDQCDMSRFAEESAYCVADRALFFKVEQPFGIRKSMGMMLHTCDWSCGQVHYVFDGTAYKK